MTSYCDYSARCLGGTSSDQFVEQCQSALAEVLSRCPAGSVSSTAFSGRAAALDVLFVIDNSSSMATKQLVLAQNIPQSTSSRSWDAHRAA